MDQGDARGEGSQLGDLLHSTDHVSGYPSDLADGQPADRADSEGHGSGKKCRPPAGESGGEEESKHQGDSDGISGSSVEEGGSQTIGPGAGKSVGSGDGTGAAESVGGDKHGEGLPGSERGKKGDADESGENQGEGAERPEARIVEDRQTLFAGPTAAKSIGYVGQAIFVEASGDKGEGGDGEGGGGEGREEVTDGGEYAGTEKGEEESDEWEPGDGGGGG